MPIKTAKPFHMANKISSLAESRKIKKLLYSLTFAKYAVKSYNAYHLFTMPNTYFIQLPQLLSVYNACYLFTMPIIYLKR